MPIFHYKGRNALGEPITGQLEASSSSDVASHLFNLGITPIDITEARAPAPSPSQWFATWRAQSSPDLTDLIMFSRQMATLLKAGIPIMAALQGLEQHLDHPGFRRAIQTIISDLAAGHALSSAMHKHPHIFSSLFISMIHVGENTGQLDRAFQQIQRYLDTDKQTRDRIKSALRYPAFVVIALVAAMFIINLFVIPAFSGVFAGFHAELPWATRLLISSSQLTLNYWPVMLIGLIALFIATSVYIKSEQGRLRWNRYKLRLPLAGHIIYQATLARFARAFSMAFRAGIPITQTLSIVGKAVDNRYVEHHIQTMREGLEHGESLTQTAHATNLFPPLVLQMLAVGEETGSVDQMLDEIAEFYEQEVEYDTQKLSSAIEPIMIVIIGILVLILALGIFLPMWDLGRAALQH